MLGDPRGPEGELRIYPTPSQKDTAGVRVFEDEQGRWVQRILYAGGTHHETAPGRFSPFLECTEEGLVPYRIEEYEYDAQGRKSEVRWLGPDGRLARTTRYVYDRGGSRGEVFDGRTGRKLYQTHASTTLGFDRDEEVITIQEGMPGDTEDACFPPCPPDRSWQIRSAPRGVHRPISGMPGRK